MTLAKTLTIDDMWHITEPGRYDLIRGELRVMPLAGGLHGQSAVNLGVLLWNHVKDAELGTVFGTSTGFVLGRDPDTLLAPDIAFARHEQLQSISDPGDFLHFPPDFAVELVSPWDGCSAVTEKVTEYLAAGTSLVWVVDPQLRLVIAYTPDRNARVYVEGDQIDCGDIVPGFRIPVSKLFE